MDSSDYISTMTAVTTIGNGTEPNRLREILTLTSQIVNITGLVVIMISMGSVIDFKDIKETVGRQRRLSDLEIVLLSANQIAKNTLE